MDTTDTYNLPNSARIRFSNATKHCFEMLKNNIGHYRAPGTRLSESVFHQLKIIQIKKERLIIVLISRRRSPAKYAYQIQ